MDGGKAPSLRHLRVFAKVAELKSVRKAADAVFLSQPAVTQAIANVEAQVGATLFERRSSGTYLRAAGSILAFRTEMMFRQIEEALAEFGLSKGHSIDAIAQRITRSQIRVLTAIASSCSFADAARKLDISPVSLHRAARDLERNLLKPLFFRSNFGIVTTRAGTELARKVSLAMREVEWAIEEIQAAEGRLGGQLRVGAMPLSGSILLGSMLNDITNHFPQAEVHVRTGDSSQLTNALRMGEIDFIVGMQRKFVDASEIEHEALLSSPFVLVARCNHPLSKKAKITLADLEPYDWVAPAPGATRRVVFDDLFAEMTNPPKPNIEATALATIRLLISGSDRLTLLTRYEFEHEKGVGALMMLPYAIQPVHSIGVSWRAEWAPTALHLKFLELLRAKALNSFPAERQNEVAASLIAGRTNLGMPSSRVVPLERRKARS